MRVLIASHYLGGLTGSETFWYTVADHLLRLGAEVYGHANVWGRRTGELVSLGVEVFPFLGPPKRGPFDVALVSHGPVAEEVGKAFPDVPIFYFCHGVLPALERPPGESVNIRRYYAVSLEVAVFLRDLGVPADKIHGPFQPVDSERFRFHQVKGAAVPRVLVVSNRMPREMVDVVEAACGRVQAELQFVGEGFQVVGQDEVEELMHLSHVVISLGRGVIEGMMSGAVPIVYDYLGCDGVVTRERFSELAMCNFSGRVHREKCCAGSLAIWIQIALQTSAAELRREAVQRYDARGMVKWLWQAIQEEVDCGNG